MKTKPWTEHVNVEKWDLAQMFVTIAGIVFGLVVVFDKESSLADYNLFVFIVNLSTVVLFALYLIENDRRYVEAILIGANLLWVNAIGYIQTPQPGLDLIQLDKLAVQAFIANQLVILFWQVVIQTDFNWFEERHAKKADNNHITVIIWFVWARVICFLPNIVLTKWLYRLVLAPSAKAIWGTIIVIHRSAEENSPSSKKVKPEFKDWGATWFGRSRTTRARRLLNKVVRNADPEAFSQLRDLLNLLTPDIQAQLLWTEKVSKDVVAGAGHLREQSLDQTRHDKWLGLVVAAMEKQEEQSASEKIRNAKNARNKPEVSTKS